MMTVVFDNVPPRAFHQLTKELQGYEIEIFQTVRNGETLGTFRSVAGAGTFAYDRKRLTVTILRDEGHFSRLMIKGGLRQLVSEAVEREATAYRTF